MWHDDWVLVMDGPDYEIGDVVEVRMIRASLKQPIEERFEPQWVKATVEAVYTHQISVTLHQNGVRMAFQRRNVRCPKTWGAQ